MTPFSVSAGAFGRKRAPVCLVLLALALSSARPSYAEKVRTGVLLPGTPSATRYWVKQGKDPGPVVVLLGGCHGDEPAGYLAADKIKQWQITRGTLWILPRAHRQAIERNVRGYPGNMNNMFPGRPNGDLMEQLSYAIWGMIGQSHGDLLLSLHESRDFHARDPQRFGQTLTYDSEAEFPVMQRVLDRVNPAISPRGDKFLHYVKPFPHCPTYNAWTSLHMPATGIETSKTLGLQTRIRYQLMVCMAFFDEWGLGYRHTDLPYLDTHGDLKARLDGNAAGVNPKHPRIEKLSDATVASHPPAWRVISLLAGLGGSAGWLIHRRRQ